MQAALALLVLAGFVYSVFQLFRLAFRKAGAGRALLIGFAVMAVAFTLFGFTVEGPPMTEVERAALAAQTAEKEAQRAAAQAKSDADAEAEKKAEACTDENMFRATAKELVLERLKAPATAEFPSYSEVKIARVTLDSCRYILKSYVDAQNSFGAQIRNDWLVDIEYLPDTDKYVAHNVAIQPR